LTTMKETLTKEIVLNNGVSAGLHGKMLTIKGPHGEVQREFLHPKLNLRVADDKIILTIEKGTKKEKTILGAFQAHIRNMNKGVQENHRYVLKICSGHFPMTVSVSGQEVVIKNFLGEAVPRKAAILPGVDVKVKDTEIVIISADREAAGQTAARIENACRVTKRDRRIFQDGCYITIKAGKVI
ncbi:MAG: 50S ribosomal protein L6, partial [Nanoarchaeota archaeon]|nr:50S ribosomal protein L6 [Nanoarchaeota archaeon]